MLKSLFRVTILSAGLLALGSAAQATPTKQTTKLTFTEPVHLPGITLPAGTYVFEEIDASDAPGFVRVMSSDRTRVYATRATLPVQRNSAEGSEMVLAKTGDGTPARVLEWYFPGRRAGFEFVYGKNDRTPHVNSGTVEASVHGKADSERTAAGE